jgi:hypothetical protein
MAKKRKRVNHRRKPNPAAPKLRTGVMVPVRGVMVNSRGVVQKVIVEDKNMAKALKRAKR